MGKKNIRHEMRNSVFSAFNEGAQKKELKADGQGSDRVFSYTTRNNLLDRIKDYCHTMQPKSRADLNPENVEKYLDMKAQSGCSQRTLDEYRSQMGKIGRIMHLNLSVDKIYANSVKDTHRGAQSVISAPDFAKLCAYIENHPSKSGLCILLEKEIGVRVSDLCYGVEIKNQELHIRSKNGKVCVRVITPAVMSILKQMNKEGMFAGKKLVAPKDNSINTYLRRTEDKLKIERHSFHDLRRRIAQDKYDEYRKSAGMERSEALRAVSVWLNHGEKRESMILKSYIANAW